jgi:hypothetical protein
MIYIDKQSTINIFESILSTLNRFDLTSVNDWHVGYCAAIEDVIDGIKNIDGYVQTIAGLVRESTMDEINQRIADANDQSLDK